MVNMDVLIEKNRIVICEKSTEIIKNKVDHNELSYLFDVFVELLGNTF